MRKLPTNIKIFLMSIYLLTSLSILFFGLNANLYIQNASYIKIVFFIFLIAFTETCTVAYKKISFSTSFAIQLASFILFGPLLTILIILIGFSFRVLKVNNGYKHIFNTPMYGTIANQCILILPVIYGNYVYLKLAGEYNINNLYNEFFAVAGFCLVVCFINTVLISILLSITTKKKLLYSFLSNTKLMILNILVMAPFGIMLAYVFSKFAYGGVILVLVPIVLTRYTFSLYIQSKSQYVETVDALMLAMEARDKYTEGHSKRVAEISARIAKELKYSDWKIERLNMAALLHDVGKIGIDDQILNKPGKLTVEEFDIIKTHPQIGYNILKDIKNLESILPIVRNHHERFDGKGYPDGKTAEELSLDVFIIQLADSIDAMATDRPYRKALHPDVVIEEVKKYSGTQFHPKVVEAYFKMLEKQKK